jgi:GR25 family glycosyltransferase involved in LPS biosynthesis
MSIPVYMINLEARQDRLRHSLAEAEAVGMVFEVVPAIPASAIDPTDVAISRQSPGRVACWKSHVRAWERAQGAGTAFALILEDDVRWLRNPAGLLKAIDAQPSSAFDLLQLGSLQHGHKSIPLRARMAHRAAKAVRAGRMVHRSVEIAERWLTDRSQLMSRSLNDVEASAKLSAGIEWGSFGSGTHAYVISTSAIPSLLAYNSPVFLAADDALSALAHQNNFRIGQVLESMATQAPLASDLR